MRTLLRARPDDLRRLLRLYGINHLQHAENMGQYAATKGVPAPEQAVQATGAMLLAGGLSVMSGFKPRQGLAALIGFLVPVTLQMHRFWEEADAQKRQAEMVNFMKNMALVGAALAMMQIDEPWPASLDAAPPPTRKCSFASATAIFRRCLPDLNTVVTPPTCQPRRTHALYRDRIVRQGQGLPQMVLQVRRRSRA